MFSDKKPKHYLILTGLDDLPHLKAYIRYRILIIIVFSKNKYSVCTIFLGASKTNLLVDSLIILKSIFSGDF